MSQGARRATLAEVAALAGVSIGTASKALNGQGKLRPDTRQRVIDAAERLSFQPSALAHHLLTGRSYTVGLLTTDSVGRFSIPVLLGAEEALGAGQLSVLLCDTRGDLLRERHYVRTLLSRRIDGIIVTGRRTDARPPLADAENVPVVYAFGPSSDPNHTSVVPDDGQGAMLAVDHLIAMGRRRIAHVTGPSHHLSARVRAAHAVATIAGAGLELAGGRIHNGAWTEEWGRQAVRVVLRAAPDCDAIFCGNDQIARGVADGLRDMDRLVPDDIALVGFDNWEVMAVGSRPPLTSVDMNLTELGRVAASLLLDTIAGNPTPGTVNLPCHLVVRESTAIGG